MLKLREQASDFRLVKVPVLPNGVTDHNNNSRRHIERWKSHTESIIARMLTIHDRQRVGPKQELFKERRSRSRVKEHMLLRGNCGKNDTSALYYWVSSTC